MDATTSTSTPAPAPAPTPPLSVMPDWERRAWEAHVGTWTSHYTVRDASGAVVDAYAATNDIALDWARNAYAQRNIYTRSDAGGAGTRSETRRYTARWDGRTMRIQGKVLRGEARAHDANTLVLRFEKPSLGEEVWETIVLAEGGGGLERGRVQQVFEKGVMVRVTSVFGEKRVSATPAIDADGRDL